MSVESPMPSGQVGADMISPQTTQSPSTMRERKFSTVTDDQSFIPATMRALYYSPAAGPGSNTWPTKEEFIPAREENSLDPATRAQSMVQMENSALDPRSSWVPPAINRAGSTAAPRTVQEPTALSLPSQRPGPANSLILDASFPTPQPATHQYLLKVLTAAFCQDELRLAMALNPAKTTPQIPLHSICATVITTPPQDHDRPLGPRYRIGDVVWGVLSYTRDGGAAEYVIANENELALKPPNFTSTEAAALALPALTAWGAFFRVAGLDPDALTRIQSNALSGSGSVNGSGKSGKGSGYSGTGSGVPEQRNSLSRLSFGSGGFGFGVGGSGRSGSIGHRFSLASLTGSNGNASPSPVMSPGASPSGKASGSGSGRKLSMASIGSFAAASGRKLSLTSSSGSESGGGLKKKKRLRVLVTNARDSEVGRIAVQMLRAEKLFPTAVCRPWICVTCTVAEETVLRDDWSVDEILVIPHLPTKEECDLGTMFRERRWAPVDIVLDCTGGEVFRQAHSKDVVRDYGAVLTAVDPKPVREPATAYEQDMLKQRKGLRSRFVPVSPDHVAMKRISELVEDRVLRGREEQVVDLGNAAKLLEGKAAGAAGCRRGGMMVVRVSTVY